MYNKKTNKNNITYKISVIGLGYVGLPLAVEFGKQYEVIGFDVDERKVKKLLNFDDETNELTPEEIRVSEGLKITCNENDISDSNIYIIAVPTPIDKQNKPDLTITRNASELVGKYLADGDIVIYESTVYPGCTEEICIPILEKYSNLLINKDFYCGYSPERIVPGDKKNTLTKIRKITSGSDEKTADIVDRLYSSIIPAGTYKASSIKVAEAAKVAENTQRDINIAFTNELSQICNSIGIDTLDVLEAAGSKWNFLPFRPGIVGGHCIGVDPYYLAEKSISSGVEPKLILASREVNESMAEFISENVLRELGLYKDLSKCSVGILGFTFKDNCPDYRNTKVIDIYNSLVDKVAEVVIADSWADSDAVFKDYGIKLVDTNTFCVDFLIVAVGHSEYINMDTEDLKAMYKKSDNPYLIADIKGVFDRSKLVGDNFSVFRL